MRAIVTGSTGFVGARLITQLLAQGWKLTVVVRDGSKINPNVRNKLDVVVADLRDGETLRKSLKAADVVFNIAGALPHHRLTEKEYWDINVGGTENLLGSVRQGLKRFVHVSTVGIYGPTSEKAINENSPRNLTDAYSKSKAKGEDRVMYYFHSKGLPVTIIRPTIGYGPGDTRPGFLQLFKMISKGIYLPVGREDNFFHTIYIDNLVDALLLASSESTAIGKDFIIGDDPCPRMNQIISSIEEASGKRSLPFRIPVPMAQAIAGIFDQTQRFNLPSPLTTRRLNFITENRKYKIDKAKKLLGYKATISLKKGTQQTFEWYKSNNLL